MIELNSKSLIQIALVVLVVWLVMKMMKKPKTREGFAGEHTELLKSLGELQTAGGAQTAKNLKKCGDNPGNCIGDTLTYKVGLGDAFSNGGIDPKKMGGKDVYKMLKTGKDLKSMMYISDKDVANKVERASRKCKKNPNNCKPAFKPTMSAKDKKKAMKIYNIKKFFAKMFAKELLDMLIGGYVDKMMAAFGASQSCAYFEDFKAGEAQSLVATALITGMAIADPTGLSGDVPKVEKGAQFFKGNAGSASQVYFYPDSKELRDRKMANKPHRIVRRENPDYSIDVGKLLSGDFSKVMKKKHGNHCEHMDHLEGEFYDASEKGGNIKTLNDCAAKCRAAQGPSRKTFFTENGAVNQYIPDNPVMKGLAGIFGLEKPKCRVFAYNNTTKNCMLGDRTYWSYWYGYKDWMDASCPYGSYTCPSFGGIYTGKCYCSPAKSDDEICGHNRNCKSKKCIKQGKKSCGQSWRKYCGKNWCACDLLPTTRCWGG